MRYNMFLRRAIQSAWEKHLGKKYSIFTIPLPLQNKVIFSF